MARRAKKRANKQGEVHGWKAEAAKRRAPDAEHEKDVKLQRLDTRREQLAGLENTPGTFDGCRAYLRCAARCDSCKEEYTTASCFVQCQRDGTVPPRALERLEHGYEVVAALEAVHGALQETEEQRSSEQGSREESTTLNRLHVSRARPTLWNLCYHCYPIHFKNGQRDYYLRERTDKDTGAVVYGLSKEWVFGQPHL